MLCFQSPQERTGTAAISDSSMLAVTRRRTGKADLGKQDEQAAARLMVEILFDKGWNRSLPPATVEIVQALALEGPQTRADLDSWLREYTRSKDGLDSFAWDDLEPCSEESLAESRARFPEFDDEDDLRTAEEINASEAADRELQLATNDHYMRSIGLTPNHTVGGVLDLMVASQVLLLDAESRYSMNPNAPLPAEVLALSAQEQELQDKLRWQRLHEPHTNQIIALFKPDSQLIRTLRPSLNHLAAELECDPESARHAVAALVESPDFSASANVLTVDLDDEFDLSVDWDKFATNRITVRLRAPDSDD